MENWTWRNLAEGRVVSLRSEGASRLHNSSSTHVYRNHTHSDKPFLYPDLPILIISNSSLVNKAIVSCVSRTHIRCYQFSCLEKDQEASDTLCKMCTRLHTLHHCTSARISSSNLSLGSIG
jgi:hypothetical protein